MTFPRPNVDIFRNARQNFLRRQQADEDADLERQQSRTQHQQAQRLDDLHEPHYDDLRTPPPVQEMAQRPSPASTILRRFAAFQRPSFSFTSGTTPRQSTQALPRPSSSRYSSSEIESPKTPLFNFLPSRSRRPSPARAPTEVSSTYGSHPRMSGARGSDEIAEPAAALAADMLSGRQSRRRFDGADPAELHLAGMAEDGRQRRERRHRHGRRHRHRRHGSDGSRSHGSRRSDDSGHRRSRRRRPPPKHFLFCFPWVKSRAMRNVILRCFVSGIFLTLILTIYLALSLTKNMNSSEFTLLFIIFILFATIIFCHGLVRLCILIVRPPQPPSEDGSEGDRPDMHHAYGPGGYAVPSQPIRVTLARDEEAAGIEDTEAKAEPPAYGKWRESVRVDPNRLFWQRSDDSSSPSRTSSPAEQERPATSGSRRPPSYASDDGVSYIVEAQPRSMAPTTDVPLPPHPSEAGRVGRFAEHI